MTFKLYAIRVFSTRWNDSLAFYRDRVGLPLAFESEEQGWAQCDLGGVYLGAPERQPWGGVLAHLKDPDGNIVTLLGNP
ncbi:MAG: hypothetical protein U5O39_10170 [Gammaproteobacteria bacterium]|nr:hypothetical protein [Gammaproteobacteria bacterium]